MRGQGVAVDHFGHAPPVLGDVAGYHVVQLHDPPVDGSRHAPGVDRHRSIAPGLKGSPVFRQIAHGGGGLICSRVPPGNHRHNAGQRPRGGGNGAGGHTVEAHSGNALRRDGDRLSGAPQGLILSAPDLRGDGDDRPREARHGDRRLGRHRGLPGQIVDPGDGVLEHAGIDSRIKLLGHIQKLAVRLSDGRRLTVNELPRRCFRLRVKGGLPRRREGADPGLPDGLPDGFHVRDREAVIVKL